MEQRVAETRRVQAQPFLLLQTWHRVTSSLRSMWHVETSVSLGVTRHRRNCPFPRDLPKKTRDSFVAQTDWKNRARLYVSRPESDRVIDRPGSTWRKRIAKSAKPARTSRRDSRARISKVSKDDPRDDVDVKLDETLGQLRYSHRYPTSISSVRQWLYRNLEIVMCYSFLSNGNLFKFMLLLWKKTVGNLSRAIILKLKFFVKIKFY